MPKVNNKIIQLPERKSYASISHIPQSIIIATKNRIERVFMNKGMLIIIIIVHTIIFLNNANASIEPSGAVYGGYSRVFTIRPSSPKIQGGNLQHDLMICFSENHCPFFKFALHILSHEKIKPKQSAFNLVVRYKFQHLVYKIITFSYGIGIGIGGYNGCLNGDVCGGGGIAWLGNFGISLKVLPWMRIEFTNEVLFQYGKPSVDIVMFYTPILSVRFGWRI